MLAVSEKASHPLPASARQQAEGCATLPRRGGGVSIFGEGVTGMDMEMEVKADALEGAFDAVLAAEAVDELKASVAALKTQVDEQAVAASRLQREGAKAAADPARDRKSGGWGKGVCGREENGGGQN